MALGCVARPRAVAAGRDLRDEGGRPARPGGPGRAGRGGAGRLRARQRAARTGSKRCSTCTWAGSSLRTRRGGPADVERAVPDIAGSTATRQRTDAGGAREELVTYVDPTSHWRFGFYFNAAGGWIGFNSASGTPPLAARPRRNALVVAYPSVRNVLLPAATIAWLRAAARRRGDEAHRPVSGAHPRLAHGGRHDGGGRQAHPGYTWFSTSNDSLWLTLAAPGISLVLLVAARRRAARRRRELLAGRLCLRCGYDLPTVPTGAPSAAPPRPVVPAGPPAVAVAD